MSSHQGSLRVLIVGGGPTGSTTAIALAASIPDAQVLLVDRAVFPRDKACGDGLGPGARRTLHQLGCSHLLEGFNRPVSVSLTGPEDIQAEARGPIIGGKDLSGFVAPRIDLDNRLLEECRARGIEVRTPCRFRALSDDSGGAVQVTLEDVRSRAQVVEEFDLVVGADGAYSAVRGAAGLAAAPKNRTHIAIRSYASIASSSQDVGSTLRLDFIDALLPAYGWVFPVTETRANIGVGIPISKLSNQGQSLKQMLSNYYGDLRRRGFTVSEPEGVASHQLPHAGARLRMHRGRVVLLGDAAATINPFSGEGIFYGMAGGLQLAESLARSLDSESYTSLVPVLADFERQFKRRFRRHFANSLLAHQMLKSRNWAKIVTRAAARDESVMASGAFMMFDEDSITALDILKVLRSAIRND